MASNPGSGFRLNVLNPGGLGSRTGFWSASAYDWRPMRRLIFTRMPLAPADVFARESIAGDRRRSVPVLLLLRGDFRASERALLPLKKAGVPVAVSLKETGLHQISEQMNDRARLERFMRMVVARRMVASRRRPKPRRSIDQSAARIRSHLSSDTLSGADQRWNFSQPVRGTPRDSCWHTRVGYFFAQSLRRAFGGAANQRGHRRSRQVYNVEQRTGPPRLLAAIGFPRGKAARAGAERRTMRIICAWWRSTRLFPTRFQPCARAGGGRCAALPAALCRRQRRGRAASRSTIYAAQALDRRLRDRAPSAPGQRIYVEAIAISQRTGRERLSFAGASRKQLRDFFGESAPRLGAASLRSRFLPACALARAARTFPPRLPRRAARSRRASRASTRFQEARAPAHPHRASLTRTPLTPFSIASGIPPCVVAKTGSPLAIASSIEFGTPS